MFPNEQVIGRCSICGGEVTVPVMWWGVIPPTPTCSKCGATEAKAAGPVIPMVPGREWRTTSTTGVPVRKV